MAHRRPRNASLTVPANYSIDLDSTRADFALSPLPPEEMDRVTQPGKYDLYFKDPTSGGSDTVGGCKFAGGASGFDAEFHSNYSTCADALSSPLTEDAVGVPADGESFCVRTDQSRIAFVQVTDAPPDRLVMEIVVWDPQG